MDEPEWMARIRGVKPIWEEDDAARAAHDETRAMVHHAWANLSIGDGVWDIKKQLDCFDAGDCMFYRMPEGVVAAHSCDGWSLYQPGTGLAVIVCGGRDFNAPTFVDRALDGFHRAHPIHHLIDGDATGADRLAGQWACKRMIPGYDSIPAEWNRLGKAAGMIRNRAMLRRLLNFADRAVIAFPGGNGTAGMIKEAKAAGVKVWQMSFEWRCS